MAAADPLAEILVQLDRRDDALAELRVPLEADRAVGRKEIEGAEEGDDGEVIVRSIMGCTREELVEEYSLLQKYLLDLGDEAIELAGILM